MTDGYSVQISTRDRNVDVYSGPHSLRMARTKYLLSYFSYSYHFCVLILPSCPKMLCNESFSMSLNCIASSHASSRCPLLRLATLWSNHRPTCGLNHVAMRHFVDWNDRFVHAEARC